MESKIITCPACRGRLEVTNPNDEPVLMLKCPNPQCGARIRVRFDTGKTILAPERESATGPGYLTHNGQHYTLSEGRNIVGRASQFGGATVGIVTNDRSMSREHCLLEAITTKNGRVKVVLSDLRDTEKMQARPTLLNDEPVLQGERLVLDNGDELVLGTQLLRFTQKPLES